MAKDLDTYRTLAEHNEAAKVYIEQGEFLSAKKLLQQVLFLEPESSETNHNLAICYWIESDVKRACAHFLDAIVQNPDFEVIYNFGFILHSIGRHDLSSLLYSGFCFGNISDTAKQLREAFSNHDFSAPHSISTRFNYPKVSYSDSRTIPTKVKLFTDENYIQPHEYRNELLAAFTAQSDGFTHPLEGMFCDLHDHIHEMFELTSIEACDFVVIPGTWGANINDSVVRNKPLFDLAAVHNKHSIVFVRSDDSPQFDTRNTLVFQTSLYKETKRPYELSLPEFTEDFVERYLNGRLPIKRKSSVPIVSFAGQLSAESLHIRNTAVSLFIRNADGVEFNYLPRDGWWGGKLSQTTLGKFKARVEYVQNLVQGDYALVVRGGGNFSIRLFEALSVGRIPVFVNTSNCIPHEDFVDWKKYFIWIEEYQIGSIGKIVREFHNSISEDDFAQLQLNCRRLWEEYLSPRGFFGNLYRYIPITQKFALEKIYDEPRMMIPDRALGRLSIHLQNLYQI